MHQSFMKMLDGYKAFREKYASGDQSILYNLAEHGQKPKIMVIACCDSRVDPALMLQCDPGDLFVVRNVANIVPPYEKDEAHHGTSAALEFAVCYLNIKHIVLLGHSQCGGIQGLLNKDNLEQNDFITNWVSVIECEAHVDKKQKNYVDDYAKQALHKSYENCFTFPWIKQRVSEKTLSIHEWFFDIKSGQIFNYSHDNKKFDPLDSQP